MLGTTLSLLWHSQLWAGWRVMHYSCSLSCASAAATARSRHQLVLCATLSQRKRLKAQQRKVPWPVGLHQARLLRALRRTTLTSPLRNSRRPRQLFKAPLAKRAANGLPARSYRRSSTSFRQLLALTNTWHRRRRCKSRSTSRGELQPYRYPHCITQTARQNRTLKHQAP